MRRLGLIALALLASLLAGSPAQAADIECTWFGRCFYESPGFRIRVVDKETGQPLADVHALAEWVMYGHHGRNGPLMVQDTVSAADGMLTFGAWGPIRGSGGGLVINHDPVITLFKAGYQTLLRTNPVPDNVQETTRIRPWGRHGETVAMTPFRGTSEEWVKQLEKAAYPGTKGQTSEEQLRQFGVPYLNRDRRVLTEAQKLPRERRDVEHLVWSLGRSISFLEGGEVR